MVADTVCCKRQEDGGIGCGFPAHGALPCPEGPEKTIRILRRRIDELSDSRETWKTWAFAGWTGLLVVLFKWWSE